MNTPAPPPNTPNPQKVANMGDFVGPFIVFKRTRDKLHLKCSHCDYQTTVTHQKYKKLKKPRCSQCHNTAFADLSTTKFQLNQQEISALLNIGDSAPIAVRFQKQAFLMLLDLIPLAETKYREKAGEHSAYALNALINQARDLLSDLKIYEAKKGLAQQIATDIVHPSFITIMQTMINSLYLIKKLVESKCPDRSNEIANRIDIYAKETAHFLEQTYKGIQDRLHSELD